MLFRSFEVADGFEANELYQRNGWTDGLPIVPPTESGVREFIRASGRDGADVVGIEPVRRRHITVEKLAIAALMAGCLPEYMPVPVGIRANVSPMLPLAQTERPLVATYKLGISCSLEVVVLDRTISPPPPRKQQPQDAKWGHAPSCRPLKRTLESV